MYRKYLDSEITFEELLDRVAELVGPMFCQDELSRGIYCDPFGITNVFEPPRNYQKGNFDPSDCRRIQVA